MPEEMVFRQEYIREKRTGVWHVTREPHGKTLCGRKIVSDNERSWPGNPREKRCETCNQRKQVARRA